MNETGSAPLLGARALRKEYGSGKPGWSARLTESTWTWPPARRWP